MPVYNAFRDTALGACLLLATLTWPAPPARAQTAVPPIVTPSPATLEARDIGTNGSATQSFSVNAPEGVEFVSLFVPRRERDVFNNGSVSDGSSIWRLDASDCSGFPTSCTVEVEYVAGDDTPSTARLRVSSDSDFGPRTDVTLTGTLASQVDSGRATLARITDPVAEGDTLDIVVERTGGADGTLVAFFGDAPGTADRSDYQLPLSASRQLTWNDGDTSPRTITVRANTDALDEGTETFDFLLASEGDNFDQSGTVTIVDVPPASTGLATFVEPDAEVFEGENLELVVERSGGSDGALNATLAVDNDTASGADYRVDPPVGGTLSWAAGDTSSRTVTVRALADTVIDPDELFTLVLTSDGDDDSDQTSAVSIVDVPPPESGRGVFARDVFALDEGTTGDVIVNRVDGADGELVVVIGTEDGSADGADYEIVSPSDGVLRWGDDDSDPRAITIRALDDADIEGDQAFGLLLSNDGGDEFDQRSGITVFDTTPPPPTGVATFTAAGGSLDEGTTLDVEIARTGGTSGPLTVDVFDANGSASDADYRVVSPASGTLSWADGEAGTRAVTVEALSDTEIEPDETFELQLMSGGDEDSFRSNTITVVDVPPESQGRAVFASASGTLAEGDTLDVTVNRVDGSDGELVVDAFAFGLDASDDDFELVAPAGGTLSWTDGDTTSRTMTIRASTDTLTEANEDLFLIVEDPTFAVTGGDSSNPTAESSRVVITDVPPPDPEPGTAVFASATGSLAEGTTLDVTVNRVDGSDGELVVPFIAEDGSAGDDDYRVVSPDGGQLVWADGDDEPLVITVEALSDEIVEPDETFGLLLSNSGGEEFEESSTVTVLDATDPPPVGTAVFASTGGSVAEGDTLDIVVERAGGTGGTLLASIDVENGTAGDTDYRLVSPADGQLSWADGDASDRTVTVEALSDEIAEPDETFELRLADDGDDSERTGTVTIIDVPPPQPGTAVFASATGTLTEGTTLDVTVNRVDGSEGELVVFFAADGGSAGSDDYRVVSPGDGRLTWTDGDDTPRIITVEALTDDIVEPDETFELLLSDDGEEFEQSSAITVLDATDPPPAGTATFASTGGSVTEGDTLDIVVERTGGTNGSLSASFAATDGTAGDADYRLVSPADGQLNWDDEDGSPRTITVEALTDALVEPAETFELLLSNSGGEEFEQSSTITVLDATEAPETGTATFANLPASVTEGATLDVVVTRTGGADGTLAATFVTENGTAGDADYRIVSPGGGTLSWGRRRRLHPHRHRRGARRRDRRTRRELRAAPAGRRRRARRALRHDHRHGRDRAARARNGRLRQHRRLARRRNHARRRRRPHRWFRRHPHGRSRRRWGGSASDADYRIVSPMDAMLSWGDGDTSSRTVTVEALADAIVEPDETFDLRLGDDGEGNEGGAGRSTTITVLDVPPPETGTATFASAEGSLAEGTTLDIVVARTGGSDGSLVATFAAEDGSATGADYRIVSPDGDTLAWEDGDTSTRTIVVEALADELIEADESFSLRLASDGDDEAVRSSTITVLDMTEPPPSGFAAFSSTGGSVAEGATLDIVVARAPVERTVR